MKQIIELVNDRSRTVNASFTLAGAACLLYIASRLFCPEDWGGMFHIKGFVYLSNLVVPMLCFWVGMLLRWKFEQPKEWLVAVIAVAAAVEYGIYVWLQISNPLLLNANHLRIAILLTGFVLPWKDLSWTADSDGWKSLALCLLSTLVFCVVNYVSALTNQAENPGQVKVAIDIAWPVTLLLPIWFAAEFSLSKAGQWFGSQKWYRWIAGFAATGYFIGAAFAVIEHLSPFVLFRDSLIHWIVFLVQPITVYLLTLLLRIIAGQRGNH